MRIVICGGPSRGKSTLAHEFHLQGYPVYCGDPASTVLYQKPYTHYLPEGLDFRGENGGAVWVAKNWFRMPGPWVCEGHVMARALRRWASYNTFDADPPCDKIIVFTGPAHRATRSGQDAMHKGVMTVWGKIRHRFADIVEYR